MAPAFPSVWCQSAILFPRIAPLRRQGDLQARPRPRPPPLGAQTALRNIGPVASRTRPTNVGSDDYSGEAVWRRITDAVRQLANQTPAGPLLLYQKGSPTVTPQYHAEIRQSRRRGLCDRAAVPGYGAPAWKSFSMRAFPFLSTNPWIVAFR